MREEISIGVVRWFSDQRGFGFIAPNNGGEDLFVHHSSIQSDGFRTLAVGHEVEFQVLEDDSGRLKAIDVRCLNDSPPFADRFNNRGSRAARGNGFGTRAAWRGGAAAPHAGRSFNGGGGGGGGGGYSYTGGAGGGAGGVNGGGVCYNCRRPGHFARDCPVVSGGGGGGGCYQCGEVGHLARECPNGGGGGGGGGGTGACFNCGELGHMARECRGSGGGGGGGRGFSTRMSSGGGCFNCGKPGHFARECTEGQEE